MAGPTFALMQFPSGRFNLCAARAGTALPHCAAISASLRRHNKTWLRRLRLSQFLVTSFGGQRLRIIATQHPARRSRHQSRHDDARTLDQPVVVCGETPQPPFGVTGLFRCFEFLAEHLSQDLLMWFLLSLDGLTECRMAGQIVHWGRVGTLSIAAASVSPTISSACGSHVIFRPFSFIDRW